MVSKPLSSVALSIGQFLSVIIFSIASFILSQIIKRLDSTI